MNDTARLLIDCKNDLGEGPFWHPMRQELMWFDINAGDLYRANADGTIVKKTNFGEPVAAAALIDKDTILVASASAIIRFSLDTGVRKSILPLEADNPITRSNDSRVSPHGGWWMGTMGTSGQHGAGAVYHFRDGKLTRILDHVSIPNATCFSPDGKVAYFADSPTRQIRRAPLDAESGLPNGPWEVFVDTTGSGGVPDGAVVDCAGYVWNAQYGAGRVVRYAPDGTIDRIVAVPARDVTCPAFGGPELKTLFITTARQEMSAEAIAAQPEAGGIFAIDVDVAGQAETPIRL